MADEDFTWDEDGIDQEAADLLDSDSRHGSGLQALFDAAARADGEGCRDALNALALGAEASGALYAMIAVASRRADPLPPVVSPEVTVFPVPGNLPGSTLGKPRFAETARV